MTTTPHPRATASRRPIPHRARVAALCALLAGTALVPGTASAQGLLADDDPRRAAPLAVVQELFDAMRAGDSARVRAVFLPGAAIELMSAGRGEQGAVVQRTSLDDFARSVGTPRPVSLDERTMNERVLLDGTLAVVWTDYELWVGERFSHCGVDAFQLAETADGWKILALADTRRRTGCREEPARDD